LIRCLILASTTLSLPAMFEISSTAFKEWRALAFAAAIS